MTAKEEDLLTSRTLLKKGVALDRVLQSLIIDPRIDADSLLVGDRNAIIIAIRSSAYGNMYETKVTCPGCGVLQEHSFDLNEVTVYDGSDAAELNVINNHDGTFTTQLPKTEIEVTFKLLDGTDEKSLINLNNRKKSALFDNMITTQLSNMVVAVNGDDSTQAVNYLVQNIPSIDSRHIRAAYKLAAPNVDLTQTFECNECDYLAEMEVPLSADFFWPER